jgi:quinoprotein glucose dehydrogenase
VDFYTGLEIPAEQEGFMEITANAPGVIFEDLYIVGCKVPDELPSAPGDIRAFDVHTGELVWIFHVIPKEGEFGYESWPPDARQRLGGANCWSGMALDEERGIVYVPTASPSFDFYGGDRVGMNLFANCLLALDARTGERKWHFQTTHHDLWDRDNASPPNLVTIRRGDSLVDAVTLVTKLGYLFVFDRETGEPLFDVEERPVPTDSPIAGEAPWPTQPFPVAPPPFARQGFTPDRYTDRTPEARAFVEQEMAEKGYRTDIYAPPSLEGAVVTPAAHGGANWGGASINPETQMLFVNATDLPWLFNLVDVEALAAHNDQDGASLYQMYCAACHAPDQKGTLLGPDITLAAKSYPFQKLENVLLAGREPMPSFKHLPQEQLQAIVFYLKGMEAGEMAPESVSERSSYQAKYSFSGYGFFNDPDGYPAIKPPWGTLTAIDLQAGTIRWQVPLGEYPELTAQGLPPTGSYNRGGGIATAGGLLIIGATYDRKLRIFSQETGELLWQTKLPGASTAIPATFAAGGRQYLTLAVSPNREAGFNGGYMTFSLPE